MLKQSLWLLACLTLLMPTGCGIGKKQAQQADVHYMLGLSSMREQDPTMALREFLQAAELDPKRAEIQDALGQAYLMKKAYPEAEQHFLKAIELEPENGQYQNNLAALYLNQQRWDEAIKYFLKAGRNLFFPSPEVALTGAGFANFQKGNYVDAIGLYREAIEANPRYAQAYLRLGETYYSMDKANLAIEEFQKALDLESKYVEAHYRLGLVYLKQRKSALAKAQFEAVLQTAPDSDFARLSKDYLKVLR